MARKEKDMGKLSDLPRFRKVVKAKRADLRDYNRGGVVDMGWGWNDDAALDQMFALKVPVSKDDLRRGYKQLYLDWQEVAHYGRAVSDWKYAVQRMRDEAEKALLAKK